MVSPGFLDGNSTTMATTPVPNRIRTRVPKNSANSSARSEGLPFIADSPGYSQPEFPLAPKNPAYTHWSNGGLITLPSGTARQLRFRFLGLRPGHHKSAPLCQHVDICRIMSLLPC